MPGDPFYRTPEWKSLRTAFLRANPICSVPGCRTAATHVDHVLSRRKGGPSLDPRNLAAYCAVHHNQKTARLDHPDRAASRAPLRAFGCDAAGRPLDPNHPWNK
jgi:5-methylcytosine-specific restriction endonuclease McrA